MRAGDDPILESALEFWLRGKPPSGLPTRREIDPVHIPTPLFPYLILADVESREGQVRYRLIGHEMVHRWGQNFTGRTSSEIFSGNYRDYLEGAFALCIAERLPVFTASQFRWDVGGFLWTRRLMLPIGRSASGPVAQILIVQTWPGGVSGDHTDPMVIVPGTAPVENAPMVVVAVS